MYTACPRSLAPFSDLLLKLIHRCSRAYGGGGRVTSVLVVAGLLLLLHAPRLIASCAPATITCANVVTNTDLGTCSALVSFMPTVSGDGPPTVTCRTNGTPITSPHNFPAGTTTVDCTAVNSCSTADCSFTVTVNDT